jgi:drug/metabolite transporter (DMT)-like permease
MDTDRLENNVRTSHPSQSAARLAMLAAAVLWSTSGLFAKAPLFAEWPADARGGLLAFWRSTFAALVLLPLIRRPRWRRGLVPLGVAFAGMNITYLTAMSLSTAANAIWLQSTAPGWVFLIGVFLLREPVVGRDLVPLIFAMAGVGTILGFELQDKIHLDVLFGAASGICYATVVVSMRSLRGEDSAWVVALGHVATVVVLLPWVVGQGVWPSPEQLLVLAGFGIFQMAIPYVLLLRALRTIHSQEAAVIGLVEPVLMPLWVFLVWREIPAWWTAAGAAMILAGLLLRYVVLERWYNPVMAKGKIHADP